MAEASSAGDRRRRTPKGDKHIWTTVEDAALVDCLIRMCETDRWKADNGTFRNGYLNQLEAWMKEKLPGTEIQGNPHIESRVKLWKRQYNAIQVMLGDKVSGFGWNDEAKCITCDPKVFSDWCKSHPTTQGLRNKPFPYLDQLSGVFGNDQAVRAGAEFANESVQQMVRKKTARKTETNHADDVDELEENEEEEDENGAASVTGNVTTRPN